MEVVFGISHFDRFELLKLCLDFLGQLEFNKIGVIIKVNLYDDASDCSEFEDFINQNEFYFNRIIRNDKNLGSSRNMFNMYKDFLNNETSNYFFTLDCDLILSEAFPIALNKFLCDGTKLICFYNSSNHARNSLEVLQKELVVNKNHIGSAGTLFSRICLNYIVHNVPPSEIGYDWDWSKYLNDCDIKIYTTYRSYLLHIGFSGDNNLISDNQRNFDRALNFYFTGSETKKTSYLKLQDYFNKHNIQISTFLICKSFYLIKKTFLWLKAQMQHLFI